MDGPSDIEGICLSYGKRVHMDDKIEENTHLIPTDNTKACHDSVLRERADPSSPRYQTKSPIRGGATGMADL